VRTVVAPPRLTSPLVFERRPSEPGRSRFPDPSAWRSSSDRGARFDIAAVTSFARHRLRGSPVRERSGSDDSRQRHTAPRRARTAHGFVTSPGMNPPVEPQIDLVVEEATTRGRSSRRDGRLCRAAVDLLRIRWRRARGPVRQFLADRAEVRHRGRSSLAEGRLDAGGTVGRSPPARGSR